MQSSRLRNRAKAAKTVAYKIGEGVAVLLSLFTLWKERADFVADISFFNAIYGEAAPQIDFAAVFSLTG